jgi:hypothetical protein
MQAAMWVDTKAVREKGNSCALHRFWPANSQSVDSLPWLCRTPDTQQLQNLKELCFSLCDSCYSSEACTIALDGAGRAVATQVEVLESIWAVRSYPQTCIPISQQPGAQVTLACVCVLIQMPDVWCTLQGFIKSTYRKMLEQNNQYK